FFGPRRQQESQERTRTEMMLPENQGFVLGRPRLPVRKINRSLLRHHPGFQTLHHGRKRNSVLLSTENIRRGKGDLFRQVHPPVHIGIDQVFHQQVQGGGPPHFHRVHRSPHHVGHVTQVLDETVLRI